MKFDICENYYDSKYVSFQEAISIRMKSKRHGCSQSGQVKSSQLIQIRTFVSMNNKPNVSPSKQNIDQKEIRVKKKIISPQKHNVNKFDPSVHAKETKRNNHILYARRSKIKK